MCVCQYGEILYSNGVYLCLVVLVDPLSLEEETKNCVLSKQTWSDLAIMIISKMLMTTLIANNINSIATNTPSPIAVPLLDEVAVPDR